MTSGRRKAEFGEIEKDDRTPFYYARNTGWVPEPPPCVLEQHSHRRRTYFWKSAFYYIYTRNKGMFPDPVIRFNDAYWTATSWHVHNSVLYRELGPLENFDYEEWKWRRDYEEMFGEISDRAKPNE